jgi:DNA-binding CsgD family transcriptional regulator
MKSEEQRLKYNAYMREYMRKKRGSKPGAKPGSPSVYGGGMWQMVDKRGPDECWPWKGSTNTGYGRVQIEGRSYYAHRVIFDMVNPGVITRSSPISKKQSGFLMHLCDNRICCNPAHLKVATIKENNNDCQEKGRRNLPTGERHFRAVFSNQEAFEILELAKQGLSTRRISEKLGKNRSSVKSLLYRHKVDKLTRVTTSDADIAKIVQMRQDGCTQKTIAETMNMNLSTVKSILQRRGV